MAAANGAEIAPPRTTAILPWVWLPVALVIVATFYPGIMSNDSLASLQQARSFEFTTWHPPIMALVWSVLDRIVAGPVPMLVAQAVLYAMAATVLCTRAFPALIARWTPWLVVPVFALFPPVMALNGMIWKDVWMSALLLLALGFLFRLAAVPATERSPRRLALAGLVACCLLATAFRHNAMAATAGLLAGACFYSMPPTGKWLRVLLACVAGVAIAVALAMLASAANRLVAKPAHVTTPILMHDIAGIIMQSQEPETAAQYALSVSPALTDVEGKFLRRVQKSYRAEAAGPILRTSRRKEAPFSINVYKLDHDAESVSRAWRAMVKRYPGAYLRHRTRAFACLLQLCGSNGWARHSYVLNPRYVGTEDTGTAQTILRRTLVSPALIRLYSPALWLLVVLTAGAFVLSRHRAHAGVPLFMALSALGLATSLFFTSPIESYRYMHWVIVMGWAVPFLFLERATSLRMNVAAPEDSASPPNRPQSDGL